MSALAAPGQVLVEGSGLGLDEVAIAQREDSVVLLPPSEGDMLAISVTFNLPVLIVSALQKASKAGRGGRRAAGGLHRAAAAVRSAAGFFFFPPVCTSSLLRPETGRGGRRAAGGSIVLLPPSEGTTLLLQSPSSWALLFSVRERPGTGRGGRRAAGGLHRADVTVRRWACGLLLKLCRRKVHRLQDRKVHRLHDRKLWRTA